MIYRLNAQNTINISSNRVVVYTISAKHRGVNRDKSHWAIRMPKEVALFTTTLKSGFEDKDKNCAWNILKVNGEVVVIGYSVSKQELKIAKFVDSNKNDSWHGYPADYMRKNQDIPSTKVLKLWYDNGLISASTMKKIKGGQPCNL